MQLTMFGGHEKFIIDKPIRLIELFAGYGSQALALKYLGVNFEHWKICEWAVKSIQAYKDIHFENDNIDYSKNLTQYQIIEFLTQKGISANYNEPMSEQQIKRLGEQKQRQIYNNIQATHNLVNIQQAKGSDFDIVDTDKYCYIMTYSFPRQDLSSAGKGAGMAKGSNTRSGMLWEVERILDECDNLPQVLLMENVPEVIGAKNIKHFASWLEKLESLGYKCYWKVLNAKDFGIPQNRERCFMVSILGDYLYEFPQPVLLEKRLKDLLEQNVDEKYFLSDKMIKYISSNNEKYNGNNSKSIINRDIACSKTTRETNTRADTSDYICDDLPINYDLKLYMNNTLQRKLCNSLIESGKVKENDVIRHSYSNSRLNNWDKRGVEFNNMTPTLDTRCDCLGVVVNTKNKRQQELANKIDTTKDGQFIDFYNQITNDNIAGTITTRVDASNSSAVYNNYRIRKLTPKECFRLMGVKDEDFDKVAKNQSNASLYHLAGDSICTTVLMAIFSKLLEINWRDYLW